MKVVILCGGKGTRLSEETHLRPKPMVTIGDHPILWHIMNIYSSFNFNDFTLALGYKGDFIKQYFLNFYALNSDIRVNLQDGSVEYMKQNCRNWKVTLIDTGLETLTGGRVGRLRSLLLEEETFMLTYGDGVADVNVADLVAFHKAHGKIATVTAVRPPSRFGEILVKGHHVYDFKEKPQTQEGWINGGFFVFNRDIFQYIKGDQSILEREPLENLARDGQLAAYQHNGFWHCMDTMRDKTYLEGLVEENKAPWYV